MIRSSVTELEPLPEQKHAFAGWDLLRDSWTWLGWVSAFTYFHPSYEPGSAETSLLWLLSSDASCGLDQTMWHWIALLCGSLTSSLMSAACCVEIDSTCWQFNLHIVVCCVTHQKCLIGLPARSSLNFCSRLFGPCCWSPRDGSSAPGWASMRHWL